MEEEEEQEEEVVAEEEQEEEVVVVEEEEEEEEEEDTQTQPRLSNSKTWKQTHLQVQASVSHHSRVIPNTFA